jgi:trehalose utilization protein
MAIRALVWGENFHERNDPAVASLYPRGLHGAIAEQLRQDPELEVAVATMDEEEQGLAADRLALTDVLLWWGHRRHQEVDDSAVERVIERVWQGMGLVVLHSGHLSKVFRRLMGTPCTLKWRVAGERQRLWVASPHHPIAAGLGDGFEIENEEMYGEPFAVPEPQETVFISSFEGGEVFRSGLTWRRGGGKIFYFQPGHQTYPTYHHPGVGQVLRNAVRWAAPAPDRA